MAVAISIVTVEFPDSGERKGFAFSCCKRDGIGIAAELGVLELVDIRMDFVSVHALGIIPEADNQRFKGIIGNGIVVGIDDDFHLCIAGCSNFCRPVGMDIQEPRCG